MEPKQETRKANGKVAFAILLGIAAVLTAFFLGDYPNASFLALLAILLEVDEVRKNTTK